MTNMTFEGGSENRSEEQENDHALLYSGKGRELLLNERIIDLERVCRDGGKGRLSIRVKKCFDKFG